MSTDKTASGNDADGKSLPETRGTHGRSLHPETEQALNRTTADYSIGSCRKSPLSDEIGEATKGLEDEATRPPALAAQSTNIASFSIIRQVNRPVA